MSTQADLDPCAPLFGHETILAGLWESAAIQRLPHALLFVGPRGVGKFRAAHRCASALLCARGLTNTPRGPCGECGPCKRLRAAAHPDLFVIDLNELDADDRPEILAVGRFVPRENDDWTGPTAEQFLSMRPVEGGWRIVIVREMERANVAAQNSILKMLEEPADNVLWILECSRPSDLLATIHSRCIRVGFERLSDAETLEVLRAHGQDGANARALARWSRGSPGDALRGLAHATPQMRALIAESLRGAAPAHVAAAALWELDGEFEAKTAKGTERIRARTFFELAIAVLADVERANAGLGTEGLAHGDLAAEVMTTGLMPAASVRAALDTLFVLRRDLELNVDPPSLVDRAFLALTPSRAVPTRR